MRARGHHWWTPRPQIRKPLPLRFRGSVALKEEKKPLSDLKKKIRKIIKKEERRKLGDHPK